MAYDFPTSPIVNQTYTPAGGATYTWDGAVWKATIQGVPATVYVGDVAPTSPALNALWWNSTTGNMAIWYADADSAQWVQVSGSVSAKPTAEARNRVVNPAMQVSQENSANAGTVTAYYLADQWSSLLSTTGVVSFQRVGAQTPNKSIARLRVSVTTADASLTAGELCCLQHRIEGIRIADFAYGTSGARQSVLRFGWKSPAGTYSVAVRGNGNSRSYIANFTVTAANVDTEQIVVIPGDTTGTWAVDTTLGIELTFTVAAAAPTGTANTWNASGQVATAANTNGLATVGSVFELFDVGLYLDPNATGVLPPWQMPDEADELIACQRYYVVVSAEGFGFAGNVTSGIGPYNAYGSFPVTMRIVPALTGVSVAATSFPATYGGGAASLTNFRETRTANATSIGVYRTTTTANARM